MKKCWLAALRVLLLAGACASLTGCFDTKQEVTLNPDGSGKVVIESSFAQTELLLKYNAQTPPAVATREFVRRLIEGTHGVEAWRDVSFRDLEDGRVSFRGTAYFSDFTKLKSSVNPFLQFTVAKNGAGHLVISLGMVTSESPFPIQSTNAIATMEDIQMVRKHYRAAQPLLAVTLGTMKIDTTFRVSGVVLRASNFETNTPQTLRVRFDGARLMPAVEEKLLDADFARQLLAEGSSTNLLDHHQFLNEKLYGQKAPVLAVIKPGNKPLFDYAAEVAEARKAFPAIAKALGLELDEGPSKPAKPAVDGAPARIKVAGINWRFERADAPAMRFTGRRPGYSLSLEAELPGTILSVDDVKVSRATTLEGTDLLPKSSSSQSEWVMRPFEISTNVTFDVHLSSPPLGSKGIAEVSGFLECSHAENLRTVELVSGKLRAGAKGTEFGAEIEDIRADMTGGQKLVLRLHLGPGKLLSLKAINDAGQIEHLKERGWMHVGGANTYTFSTPRAIPRSGRLVAELLVGSESLRIPFTVTNLTLLGQPLASK